MAHLASKRSPTFAIHMLLGLILLGAIAFRLVWGLVGSRHARFASFLYSPAALVGYLKDVAAGRDGPYPGHNPGSSWAIYGMVLLPIALVVSGILAQPRNEFFEELHGVLGWVMVAAVVAHLAGIAWYTLRHKEAIALSMITGARRGEPADDIGSSRPVAALVLLVLVGGWATLVLRGHDPVARQVRIPALGLTIPVSEKVEAPGRHGGHQHEDDDD